MNKNKNLNNSVKKVNRDGIKSVISKISDPWYFLILLFLIVFSYFCFFAGYLLFFQEQQSLFIYSGSWLDDFLTRPGGPVDLAGKFLTQFYVSKAAGSLIIASIIVLTGVLLIKITKSIVPEGRISLPVLMVPPLLLLLMQTHYYHYLMYTIGYLLVLLYFMVSLLPRKTMTKYIVLAFFPVFLYIAGAYAFIFLFLYISYSLIFIKGSNRIYLPLFLLVIAGLSYFVFPEIFLLQSPKQLLLYPLPFINDTAHKYIFYFLTGFIVCYPLIIKATGLENSNNTKSVIYGFILSVAGFSVVIIILITGFNTQTSRAVNLEKLVFEERWNDAIKYHEKYPSGNLIGQYFYNVALSETDQLCDRLFSGRQDFGSASLILEWNNEHLNWGAYSFYAAGLISEAQRWAFEEMVVYGPRPQNMKMLARTSLITGNYRMAKKYTAILGKTLFYKKWAGEYGKMAEDTTLIMSHPDLVLKKKCFPGKDFFIMLESPAGNLPVLVDENKENRRAFEYLMSWLMLDKNVEILVNNIRLMKNMGYTRIPRYIEEAILIYYNSKGTLPDMGGLTISDETKARFERYFAAYVSARQNPQTLKEKMKKQFGNTFWYYFHFR